MDKSIESSISRRTFAAGAVAGSLAVTHVPAFHSRWDWEAARPWPGLEYRANPIQDWCVRAGRVECFATRRDRNLHQLTHGVTGASGDLIVTVRLGRLEVDHKPLGEGFAGFQIGIHGHFHDWRDSSIYGEVVNAGVTADGRLFIGTPQARVPRVEGDLREIQLELRAQPEGTRYVLTLRVRRAEGPWQTIETSPIDKLSRTATFRVPGWDDSKDVPYRIRYTWTDSGEGRTGELSGLVRRDTKDKPEIVLSALTGNNDLDFPQPDVVRNLRHFAPDMQVVDEATGETIYTLRCSRGTFAPPVFREGKVHCASA